MIDDPFEAQRDTVFGPATHVFVVVPDDQASLPSAPKALFVGNGGDLVLRALDSSSDVTLRNLAPGQILPIRASHVRATGTSATDIVALA